MPKNKNASYRCRLIDYFLKGGRKWKFEDFHNKIGDRLCEEFGVEALVTKRTIENDIALMRRSPPEGFGAPIKRSKGYIFYENVKYSINNMPLIPADAKVIQEAIMMMQQFKGLPHSGELMSVLHKIETHTPFEIPKRKNNVIFVEQNEQLKGQQWISPLYSYIVNQQKIRIKYRSFKRKQSKQLTFQPYLLKEFNNRWFLLGFNENEKSKWLLALDRILSIHSLGEKFVPTLQINGQEYFKEVIGVTVPNDRKKEKILLRFTPKRAPYVVTKPFHHSQKVLNICPKTGTDIQIEVIPNPELIAMILSFGSDVEVVSPSSLRNEIKAKLTDALQSYASKPPDNNKEN